jgi:hypothetical protein
VEACVARDEWRSAIELTAALNDDHTRVAAVLAPHQDRRSAGRTWRLSARSWPTTARRGRMPGTGDFGRPYSVAAAAR